MLDALGRDVRSVRISVTMRCNMRCVYCHRECERPSERELSSPEWTRLLLACAELGIEKVKITGGEPLLRRDLTEILENVSGSFKEISLVTNGVLLDEYADDLAEAGLDRVNVSLDTVDRGLYQRLTRSKFIPDDVLSGIEAAISAGLVPVKVNVVLMPETVSRLPSLIEALSEFDGLKLQLIEPLTVDSEIECARIEDGLRTLEEYEPTLENVRTFQCREVYRLNNGMVVETVRSMAGVMCKACSRIRLTHDGKYKGCILAPPKPLPLDGFERLVHALREYVRTRRDTLKMHLEESMEGRACGGVRERRLRGGRGDRTPHAG